jgi:serine/threonine-protein kinase
MPEIGDEFAGYSIERLLGRGGMGVVYLAEHIRLRQRRALKLLPPDLAHNDDFRQRFERESRLAASLEHPNIVTVFDAGEQEGLLYIAMRYIDGRDLKELLRVNGPLAPARALALLAPIAGALDDAHRRGLVHRDVKSQNILVSESSELRPGESAYLTDFGLTKHYDSTSGMTQTGTMVGTVDYMAPEQLRAGDVDARADVYSLTCVVFECLTGVVPYPKESFTATIIGHLHEDVPRLTDHRPERRTSRPT